MNLPFSAGQLFRHRAYANELPIDWPQAYRYMGYRGNVVPEEPILSMAKQALSEQLSCCRPQAVYACFPIRRIQENNSEIILDLTFASVRSQHLARHLQDCSDIIIFAATIGSEVDRLIARSRLKNAALPTVHHGIGAMLIEVYCDTLEAAIKQQLSEATDVSAFSCVSRFSPGYGDFSLQHQKDFFRILNPGNIGMTLAEDTLLMTPSKSVTAVIGIRRQ